MMRLVAVHLLLLAGLALHLCLGGVQADNHISLYRGDSPNISADGEGGLSSGGINADSIEPTNIIGRDNLCVEVKDGRYSNGNPIQVWRCGNAQLNQLWTFGNDGTIRSNGKCMTTYDDKAGDYVMIYDCPSPVTGRTMWILDYSGTITNPQSGLVLTASASTSDPTLTVDIDSKLPIQAWTRVNYTIPAICQIKGYRELCMQTNSVNVSLGMADCIPDVIQQWVLYGDRTIRLSPDRNLCVTSDGDKIGDPIILFTCQGTANQRWTFQEDRTILNPNAGLVMEVEVDGPLPIIILATHTGDDNQKWSLSKSE